jgi:hypothetical protein
MVLIIDSQVEYRQGWQDKEIERMERMAKKCGRGKGTGSESGSMLRKKNADTESVRGIKVGRGRYTGRGRGKYPCAQSSRGRSKTRMKDGTSCFKN